MTVSDGKEFGRLVRRLRKRKGLGLRETARLMHVSPAWLSKAERGLIDARKPGYASRFAGILDVDVNKLRKAAGLESLDWEEVWLRVANLGGDLVGLRVRNKRDSRLFRVLGFSLLLIGFVAARARGEGGESDRAVMELEEILRLSLLVAERRHGGMYASYTRTTDAGVKAVHANVDSVLDSLYALHAKDVEELLKSK